MSSTESLPNMQGAKATFQVINCFYKCYMRGDFKLRQTDDIFFSFLFQKIGFGMSFKKRQFACSAKAYFMDKIILITTTTIIIIINK